MDDYAPLIERAFAAAPEEGAYDIRRVEGAVPRFVRGTYYLNGPARFSRGGRSYRHWLDGDEDDRLDGSHRVGVGDARGAAARFGCVGFAHHPS